MFNWYIFPYLGSESLWPYLFSLYACLVILALTTIPFVPESPKYLYTICNEHGRALSGIIS